MVQIFALNVQNGMLLIGLLLDLYCGALEVIFMSRWLETHPKSKCSFTTFKLCRYRYQQYILILHSISSIFERRVSLFLFLLSMLFPNSHFRSAVSSLSLGFLSACFLAKSHFAFIWWILHCSVEWSGDSWLAFFRSNLHVEWRCARRLCGAVSEKIAQKEKQRRSCCIAEQQRKQRYRTVDAGKRRFERSGADARSWHSHVCRRARRFVWLASPQTIFSCDDSSFV